MSETSAPTFNVPDWYPAYRVILVLTVLKDTESSCQLSTKAMQAVLHGGFAWKSWHLGVPPADSTQIRLYRCPASSRAPNVWPNLWHELDHVDVGRHGRCNEGPTGDAVESSAWKELPCHAASVLGISSYMKGSAAAISLLSLIFHLSFTCFPMKTRSFSFWLFVHPPAFLTDG